MLMLKVKMEQGSNIIFKHDSDTYFIARDPELKRCHTQTKPLNILIEPNKKAI